MERFSKLIADCRSVGVVRECQVDEGDGEESPGR